MADGAAEREGCPRGGRVAAHRRRPGRDHRRPRPGGLRRTTAIAPGGPPAALRAAAAPAPHHPYAGGVRRRLALAALALLVVEAVVVARRRGHLLGARTVVRCRDGHLFTTLWVPGASVKALRLGWWRVQRCPVGRHWTLVTPAWEAELTDEELDEARQHPDVRLP